MGSRRAVEQPMTEHPRYAADAEMLRAFMAQGRNEIAYSYLVGEATYAGPSAGASRARFRMLHVSKAAGRAPFVGDISHEEMFYVWDVANDEIGGWVAGPTSIEWLRGRRGGVNRG